MKHRVMMQKHKQRKNPHINNQVQ